MPSGCTTATSPRRGSGSARRPSPRSTPRRAASTTDLDAYEADVVVVALGAGYDVAATPGLAEAGNEFYSVAGAEALRDVLPGFRAGTAIVGVCGPSFKCPPAPSEAALLLDGYLRERGVRDDVHDPGRDPVRHAGPAFAGDVGGDPGDLRRSRHRLHPGASRGVARPGDARGRPRRRTGDCPSTCSSASRCTGSRRWSSASGLAEDGWIPVDPRHARHPVRRRLRGGRRHERRHAEGGRVRRGRGAGGGRPADRAGPGRSPSRPATTAPARATSSSATTGWRASTWTSSRPPAIRRARSRRRRSRPPRRRSRSGRAARARWFGVGTARVTRPGRPDRPSSRSRNGACAPLILVWAVWDVEPLDAIDLGEGLQIVPDRGGHSISKVLHTAVAGSRSPSAAHASRTLPDFWRISPSSTSGPSGHRMTRLLLELTPSDRLGAPRRHPPPP